MLEFQWGCGYRNECYSNFAKVVSSAISKSITIDIRPGESPAKALYR
ncbi:unnamed protein product [Acidithrix sp. C25]|nr:unnamed protein product [Acidithrix sp. C25]